MYAFVGNDGVNRLDPFGLKAVWYLSGGGSDVETNNGAVRYFLWFKANIYQSASVSAEEIPADMACSLKRTSVSVNFMGIGRAEGNGLSMHLAIIEVDGTVSINTSNGNISAEEDKGGYTNVDGDLSVAANITLTGENTKKLSVKWHSSSVWDSSGLTATVGWKGNGI